MQTKITTSFHRVTFLILQWILVIILIPSSQSNSQDFIDSLQIIDAHTHTEFSGEKDETTGIVVTQEEYFREWREAGIVGAVAHVHEDESDYVDLKKENVVCCAGIENRVNVKKLEQDLQSGKYRCIKIYLGYVHRYAYDSVYTPVYKLAKKYKVPVVFHTGDTYSTKARLKFADPLTIDEVAVKYPSVKFVIAHCGNPWIESAAEVAYKNPNVYLDGSAFLIGTIDPQSEKAEKYMIRPISWIFGYIEDSTKLMFGTDWPLVDMKSYVDAFKRAIPQQYWHAVFYDNAARIFGFPKRKIK